MAKCTICNSRKGKRKCKSSETFICSLCCGESRTEEKCDGCSFFAPAASTRNYRGVPHYTTEQMATSSDLESIAYEIEAALCQVWANDPQKVNDRTAARLVELMIDRYHFNDQAPLADAPVLEEGFRMFSQNTGKAFSQLHSEEVVKVLAAVYRSIQRRTVGGASYLQFVSQFTDIHPGV